MFKVYAFSDTANWAVDAASIEEARRIESNFQRRNLTVRIYEQLANDAGDVVEKLISPPDRDN